MSGDPADVYVDERLKGYLEEILQATREPGGQWLSRLDGMIESGAPPEDFQRILQLARERAVRGERKYLVPEDIREAARDTLSLTLILSSRAGAEGLDAEGVIQIIFDAIEVP